MKWFYLMMGIWLSGVPHEIYTGDFLGVSISLVAVVFAWISGLMFMNEAK